MRKVLLVYLLFIAVAVSPIYLTDVNGVTYTKAGNDAPYAIFLVKNGSVYTDENVNLSLVIRNPTNYILANTSLYIIFPLDTIFVKNISSHDTNISQELIEEGYNVSLFIPIIGKNSSYSMVFEIKYQKVGTYNILTSDVSSVKVKGEYREEINLNLNDLTLTVTKKEKVNYPPEGTEDWTLIILLITLITPLTILFISHKIAWKIQ